MVTSVSEKLSVDQSELEKEVVSDCKTNYMKIPEQLLFIATNKRVIRKIFFCSKFLNILQKSWRRRRWRKPANAKRIAFQANTKNKLMPKGRI